MGNRAMGRFERVSVSGRGKKEKQPGDDGEGSRLKAASDTDGEGGRVGYRNVEDGGGC